MDIEGIDYLSELPEALGFEGPLAQMILEAHTFDESLEEVPSVPDLESQNLGYALYRKVN